MKIWTQEGSLYFVSVFRKLTASRARSAGCTGLVNVCQFQVFDLPQPDRIDHNRKQDRDRS